MENNKSPKASYIFRGLLFAVLSFILGIYIGREISWGSGVVEFIYYTTLTIGFVALLMYTLWEVDERTPEEYETLLQNKWFLPVRFPKLVTTLIIFAIIGHRVYLGGNHMKIMYNQSVSYVKQYDQKTQAVTGLYDITWKTFKQKADIAGISTDGLKYFTDVAFNSRKDGATLSWKWASENTALPYDQFVEFYTDLSSFVESQRLQMYALELERQGIARSHNMLLDTFPNNLYNKLLGRNHIDYKYVILSDSTNNVINTGKENL